MTACELAKDAHIRIARIVLPQFSATPFPSSKLIPLLLNERSRPLLIYGTQVRTRRGADAAKMDLVSFHHGVWLGKHETYRSQACIVSKIMMYALIP